MSSLQAIQVFHSYRHQLSILKLRREVLGRLAQRFNELLTGALAHTGRGGTDADGPYARATCSDNAASGSLSAQLLSASRITNVLTSTDDSIINNLSFGISKCKVSANPSKRDVGRHQLPETAAEIRSPPFLRSLVMRVGLIGISHESNTFVDTPTTLADFQAQGILRGSIIRQHYQNAHHQFTGYLQALDEAGLEAVPLLHAEATPSGMITADAADQLIAMMLEQLDAAGPLEGLLLAPHGAAVSETYRDFDGQWLSLVRQQVGPDLPLVCTIDPHANVSDRMIEACNATIAYRTNPHIDQKQTGLVAGRLLARALRGEVELVQRFARPGVSISIDQQETAVEPCARLYALADSMLEEPGILSNSVVLGFPYADVEEMGSGFVVVADGDAERAQRKADDLARDLYEHRRDFACGLTEVDQAVRQAIASPERVCLLDVGDNVGGGAPADGTVIAHALHKAGVPDCFVCLCDPSAVEQAAAAGEGARRTLEMGGHTDDRHGLPLIAAVTIDSLTDGRFTEPEPRHGGRMNFDMGPTAIVTTDGGMTVMLTTRRIPPFSLQQLVQSGLDPERFHILVAKGVNAPLAAYKPICPCYLRANTPGATCADARKLPFQHRSRPLFPFEEPAAFTSDSKH